ncbi:MULTISPECIES: FAD-binding domain-containing protein [unclassified Thiomonas]|uniref:FAD-binding domain-containing protein n=1 Tax=unclassified Thiomonas TaxID=2625466 RepID=UPI0004DBA733|nr:MULTISPECIES: FAD-binding domain-containing protein [unclassified Thiomonas]CDW94769.1 putative Deoxyribodipyrimidine photo-lyase [Thiomonas sp. CB2]VDY04123.1 putative Deoxyribodipyrimidine photo-lyase [Thiomonas sp. Bio17B3]VDY08704.1 putative Deoxyribodipyrimidine photo-lyase [Thiomonas sp. Sup16B3]VDY12370.1 putative Deoxyribodipyrimidine photo-lyase [Thiomonas sp. OC7]VDY18417.1 putative Deoxyribodipyrimidine photo-lyase [Thiomonas sp. CB2]
MTLATEPATLFEPTLAAAQRRLAAVRPADYARSRNHLEGHVTRLSPYLTHGFLGLRDVVQHLSMRHGLGLQDKLLQELGWRAFFQQVWRHEGSGILQSQHPGPLPDRAYAPALPADLREGRTGVPVIDQAVRALYATGYLHNHARMWLASYTVHLRKVHWRAGADWMVAHLLDGDLASNHLSWQWVAGTGSSKPYLFNADNVAKYAPAAWHSPGTVIDASYERLDALARQPRDLGPEPGEFFGVAKPALFSEPPAGGFSQADARAVAAQDVWLVHPWALGPVPEGRLPVAVCDTDWHARWPWSAARWQFVAARMQALAPVRWFGTTASLLEALKAARSVQGWHNPHLSAAWNDLALAMPPLAFAEPTQRCRSFSAYWSRVQILSPSSSIQGDLFHE